MAAAMAAEQIGETPSLRTGEFTSLRTGVVILCVRPTPLLEALVTPLCPYHDVYLCCDAENLPCRAPSVGRPGLISLRRNQAEGAGFLGSVSFLPKRASSRCKALYWLCVGEGRNAGEGQPPISHWWMIEEDVLVPTEAALLALDDAHPSSDLLAPHHYVKRPGSGPDVAHWSGQRSWPHWHLASGLVHPPLASSMVCAVRVSRALLSRVGHLAASRRRLLFCEMLFNTLALQAGLDVATPARLRGVVWREPRYTARFPYRPDCLYHPVKDLELQRAVRLRGFGRKDWRAFTGRWVCGEEEDAQSGHGDGIRAGEPRKASRQSEPTAARKPPPKANTRPRRQLTHPEQADAIRAARARLIVARQLGARRGGHSGQKMMRWG